MAVFAGGAASGEEGAGEHGQHQDGHQVDGMNTGGGGVFPGLIAPANTPPKSHSGTATGGGDGSAARRIAHIMVVSDWVGWALERGDEVRVMECAKLCEGVGN